MTYVLLYQGDDYRVFHDPNDDDLSYGVELDTGTEAWFTRDGARALASHVEGAIPAGAIAASEVSFNEGLLRLAAVHGKTVTFRYAKGDGHLIETRTLKPESVSEVKGHVIFTGYDPDREEPRAYRVDRMKGEVTVA